MSEMKDETKEYRAFKARYGSVLTEIAQCYASFVKEGDAKALGTFNLLILTMMTAATDEMNKQWPTMVSGGIGDKAQ